MQLGKEIGKMTRELFTGFSMRGRKRIGFILDVHGWTGCGGRTQGASITRNLAS
jgi:hypothetical protein